MDTQALVPAKVTLREQLTHRSDRVGMLLSISERHGDIASMNRLGGLIKAHFISSADLAHEVLVDKADAFVKGYGLSLFAKPLLGNGLLTSETDFHRRQRRMMAPAFVHKRIADYAAVISARTESATAKWADGATLDFSDAMMRLTL
ncbi:MAG: cytochrome P450, partial [Minicystis sp.]